MTNAFGRFQPIATSNDFFFLIKPYVVESIIRVVRRFDGFLESKTRQTLIYHRIKSIQNIFLLEFDQK